MSIGFCRPALKRKTIVFQPTLILLRRGRTYVLLCELSTILTSRWAGLEIVRGAALLLHLLKKTIFRIALYLYFPFYYTTNYSVCQYDCELRRGIFLIKTPNLLLKTSFYYTINHSFCQYSCSFKANLQLKPRFVDKTHIFSTLFYYFLSKIIHNFQLFYTIFTTFLLLLLYYFI